MKNIIKLVHLAFLAACASAFAGGEVERVFNTSSTGTTSATVFVSAADGAAEVTHLVWDLDNSVTSGTIDIRPGKDKLKVTSATTGSGSVLWFDNTGSIVASGDYLIVEIGGSVSLVRTKGTVATTSVTIQETVGTTALTDHIWTTQGTFRRYAPDITSSSTLAPVSIWLPERVPSALTVDGNSSACKISISGVRSFYK